MTDRNPDEELSGAYALGAVNDDEKASYEAFLAGSAEAQAEALSLAETAARLGLATAPVTPGPQLKASIMAKIAALPQLPAEAVDDERPQAEHPDAQALGAGRFSAGQRAPTDPSASAPIVEPVAPEPATDRADARAPAALTPAEAKAQSRWFVRPGGVLAAAAVAAALFVGGTFVGQGIVRNDFEVSQATALAQLQTAADAQQASVEVPGGGEATLIWSLEQRRSVVMVAGLKQLPQDETYQLWYIGKDGPISAGTFEAASSGASWRVLDGQMSGGDTVGITVEPAGGSEQPTTEPIVAITSA